MSPIGDRFPRVDAYDKVTGKARYPGDFQFGDELTMKIVFARRPSAVLKHIDTSKAEAVDGVLMVLTAKDVPNNEYGLGIQDQPVLCGPDSNKQDGDHVRFEGDQVALVIAESKQIANKATKLIEFDYQDLPIIETLDQALAEDTFILHPNRDSNIFHHNIVRRGSVEAAFKDCAVIVEHEYNTPVQEHAYLQPEAGVAYMDEENRITLLVGGQWTHEDQQQVAHSLQLPEDRIRVIYRFRRSGGYVGANRAVLSGNAPE
jgi:CO/xanthine dehydrogenase Mo-binding subunit